MHKFPRSLRRLAFAWLLIAVLLAYIGAHAAFAVTGSEGVGNAPDCHGQTQVPCRPDPQPSHGKDCERSDDHVCEPTTTTTAVPEEDEPGWDCLIHGNRICGPDTPETSAPTPDGQESVCGNGVSQSECAAEIAESTTENGQLTECLTTDGYPYRTTYDECPASITSTDVLPLRVNELPRTGAGSVLAWAGFVLLGLGLSLVLLVGGIPR